MGKVPARSVGEQQANTYQYFHVPRGRGGTGAKLFSTTVHAGQCEQNS